MGYVKRYKIYTGNKNEMKEERQKARYKISIDAKKTRFAGDVKNKFYIQQNDIKNERQTQRFKDKVSTTPKSKNEYTLNNWGSKRSSCSAEGSLNCSSALWWFLSHFLKMSAFSGSPNTYIGLRNLLLSWEGG